MQELIVPITGVTLCLVVGMLLTIAKISSTVARMDKKVDLLLKQAKVDLNAVAQSEVEKLMREGRKIEAIKLYRELTGVELAEAKAAVERI